MSYLSKLLLILVALLLTASQEKLYAKEEAQAAQDNKGNGPRAIAISLVKTVEIEKQKDEKDINPQIKALAAQMQQTLKPFFAAELSFAKEVCQPNQKQLLNMKSQANPALRKATLSFAKQQGPQMGIGNFLQVNRKKQVYILDCFEEEVLGIVQNVFEPNVVTLYQEERKHRKEFRARAGAMILVGVLDSSFRLTPEQRIELTESISKVWQRQWQSYLDIMVHNPHFFPPVPDTAILPHLNKAQIILWKNKPRNAIGFGWQNLNHMNQRHFQNVEKGFDWFGNANEDKEASLERKKTHRVYFANLITRESGVKRALRRNSCV